MDKKRIEEAARLLESASSLVFFTGAGVSKESGIPTFRDALSGLWAKFDPEELATPDAFKRNPDLVWQWYDDRRRKIADVKPNPGHYAIAELEKYLSEVHVITQNVDSLHKTAGSSDVIELHGNICEFYCFDKRHPAAAAKIAYGLKEPPRCHCGSLIRPAVVWFYEALPELEFERAQQEIIKSSVLFVVGTSSLVYPAAGLPMLALRKGIPLIEINPEETPLSRSCSLSIRGASGEVLPELLATFKTLKSPGRSQ